MKLLEQPIVDDLAKLTAIANKAGLKSYPALKARIRRISNRYKIYGDGGGDPWKVPALARRDLEAALRVALQNHYLSPPKLIDYLQTIRKEASPLVCSMCGSLKSGTLDHVLPKAKYAEFSFFSKNLVPACDCNTKRGERYKGTRRGQRVLHPYFDSVLQQRLIRASIKPRGDYSKPDIKLVICIRPRNPVYSAVKYHLENVIQRTDVLSYLSQYWKSVLRNPDDHVRLPPPGFTVPDFDGAIRDQLFILDRQLSTPNNWKSMLFAGLVANSTARAFLMQTVLDLRNNRKEPEDA